MKILLVEDDVETAAYIAGGLEEHGQVVYEFTGRTDYICDSATRCDLFVSSGQHGEDKSDFAYLIRTTYGGNSFRYVSRIVPASDDDRSVMPSTVRISDSTLITLLCRRERANGKQKDATWIDCWGSYDNGQTWWCLSYVDKPTRPRPPGQRCSAACLRRTHARSDAGQAQHRRRPQLGARVHDPQRLSRRPVRRARPRLCACVPAFRRQGSGGLLLGHGGARSCTSPPRSSRWMWRQILARLRRSAARVPGLSGSPQLRGDRP
jgi:hypothetical protein